MYDGQEELDNLVWDKNDEDWDESLKQMRLKTTCRQVEELAEQRLGMSTTLVSPLIIGGFNVLYRIHLEDVSPDILVRLPGPSLVQFPDEKTVQEAATAIYIANNIDRLGVRLRRPHAVHPCSTLVASSGPG